MVKKLIKFISKLFCNKCHKCEDGCIKYIGEDFTGYGWINVYQCNKCKERFI